MIKQLVKRYTIVLGENNELKEIIDYYKKDKDMCVFEFLKQDKTFKELK